MFPPISAPDLNKREVQLPSGLSGDVNLVLIAFLQKQQADVDTWLAVLPVIASKHPQFAYYEIPVIERMNPVVRWWINRGMRSGIPDEQQRGRTVTLYLDKKPFREALDLPAEDRIYALLVDKAGRVLWRAEGRADAEKQRSLEQFLAAP